MLNPNSIKPQYDSYCFLNIPPTIQYLLTGEKTSTLPADVFGQLPQKYNIVILFFIDSFGWRFFEKYQDHPSLKNLVKEGVVSKLTSLFPSTTAAHVTCIHTGLAAGQSGVYEWQYYEPELDTMIASLPFSFAGASRRELLQSTGVDPKKLYPTQTIYPTLQQHGVTTYAFQHVDYARSTYSDLMFTGAKMIPYKTLSEVLVNIEYLLTQQKSPAYLFFYFGDFDTLSHHYGPNSAQLEAEIDTFLTILDRRFLQPLRGKLKDTLLILTADHGQIEVNPQTTIYLNLKPQFAGLQHYFKTNQKGELLVPAGSCRDMFLYIKEEHLDEVQAFIDIRLAGQAEVYRTQTLIEQGYFGPPPLSDAFLGRVGNLVILPYPNEAVWWYEKDRFEQKFYGHHGGLTRPEMEIPFLLYNFAD
jgi:predicted AlkP superfamily pyrophosphatase or phosphodiesterase